MDYKDLTFSQSAVAAKAYKATLGGGSDHWHARGLFQLHLLQSRGLRPDARLLDIGCGPLRSGVHTIGYLDAARYCGIDSNAAFIAIAKQVVAEAGLVAKAPVLEVTEAFACPDGQQPFDFGLMFSVLNHCTPDQRRLFFRTAARMFRPGARILISHAGRWFWEGMLDGSGLFVSETLAGEGIDLQAYGWDGTASVFPVIELGVGGAR